MKKTFTLIVTIFFSAMALAQDYSDPAADGEIVVEKPTDLTQNYRQRRGRYGILFSVNYEKFSPNEYYSIFQQKTFEQLSDNQNMDLVSAELGLKMNFSFGSVAALAGYGQSEYTNDAKDIYSMDAKITKVSLNLALDNLMSEPWVVPYGQVGAHQINWEEQSYDSANNLVNQSVSTNWTYNYKLGLLLQLDWIENAIDPNTHINAIRSSGLQNTFVDIFYQSYGETNKVSKNSLNQTDPDGTNLQSDNFGVGLKLEF